LKSKKLTQEFLNDIKIIYFVIKFNI